MGNRDGRIYASDLVGRKELMRRQNAELASSMFAGGGLMGGYAAGSVPSAPNPGAAVPPAPAPQTAAFPPNPDNVPQPQMPQAQTVPQQPQMPQPQMQMPQAQAVPQQPQMPQTQMQMPQAQAVPQQPQMPQTQMQMPQAQAVPQQPQMPQAQMQMPQAQAVPQQPQQVQELFDLVNAGFSQQMPEAQPAPQQAPQMQMPYQNAVPQMQMPYQNAVPQMQMPYQNAAPQMPYQAQNMPSGNYQGGAMPAPGFTAYQPGYEAPPQSGAYGMPDGYAYQDIDRPSESGRVFSKKVISVYSPKGGSGKTSVSKELACTFIREDARINGRKPRVLLIDMDFTYADLHTVFNIRPEHNVMDWIKLMQRDMQNRGFIPPYDKRVIDKFITRNVFDGLDFLSGPKSTMDAKLIREEHIRAICQGVRACDYDVIIFDNAPSSEERTLAILESSDAVIVLSTLDTTTSQEMADFFRVERERSFDASKFHLVINKVPINSADHDIKPEELISTYAVDFLGMLPEDDNVRKRNNDASSLMLETRGETTYVKSMKKIANGLVNVFEEKKGFLARLFGK